MFIYGEVYKQLCWTREQAAISGKTELVKIYDMALGLIEAQVKAQAKCECGGKFARTTHSTWCPKHC